MPAGVLYAGQVAKGEDDATAMSARESELLQAVEQARADGTSAQVANALDHLARHCHEHRRYAAAARAYTAAIAHWRELLGADHPVVASQLINLGEVHMLSGDLHAARGFFVEGLAIMAEDPQFDDCQAITVLRRFVGRLRQAGDLPGAHRLAQQIEVVVARTGLEVEVAVPSGQRPPPAAVVES